MKKEVGSIFIDLGKLAFAGMVLAGLIEQNVSPLLLVTVGGIVTITTLSIGLYITWLDKKNKK